MTAPELFSLILSLRPERSAPAPDWWGRAAHALALRLVQAARPDLAEAIHNSNSLPPFTVSTLVGEFPNQCIDPGEVYQLRLTSLMPEVAECFKEILYQPEVELERVRFTVIDLSLDRGALPSAYSELASRYLVSGGSLIPRLALAFESPTFFQASGQQVTDLVPGAVFGSLLRRWNAHASVIFPKETAAWAAENVRVVDCRLERQRVFLAGGWYPGVTGSVVYACDPAAEPFSLGVLNVLADFAAYAGVGAKTAMGMGQSRRVEA